jgi:hypothetical protein
MEFNIFEKVKEVFENLDGCEVIAEQERKFDMNLQKMVETGRVKIKCKLSPNLSKKMFNEIKCYRIVGKGGVGERTKHEMSTH